MDSSLLSVCFDLHLFVQRDNQVAGPCPIPSEVGSRVAKVGRLSPMEAEGLRWFSESTSIWVGDLAGFPFKNIPPCGLLCILPSGLSLLKGRNCLGTAWGPTHTAESGYLVVWIWI